MAWNGIESIGCLRRKSSSLQKPENGWENQQITKDGRYGGYGGKWGCKANGKWLRYGDPRVAKERSKTFPGIAKAMAEQWGKYIEEERKA